MNGDFFCGTRDALDYEGLLSLLLPQCFVSVRPDRYRVQRQGRSSSTLVIL